MKKCCKIIFAGTVLLSMFLISCASLQEDKMVETRSGNAVASETASLEDSFREFDASVLSGKVVSIKEMDKYCSDIEKRISSHAEPYLIARLQAYEGLVQLLENKPKKASDLYGTAKALQSGDECVLLLNARLQPSIEESISVVNEYLTFDSDNPVYILEMGILCYKAGAYAESVASFDSAFLLFDSLNKTQYRELYSPLRDNAWKFYSSGMENVSVSSSQGLSCERMVSLTKENSGLLWNMTEGFSGSSAELIRKLEKAGYFNALGDTDAESFSSREITSSKELTRTLCARFLWNMFIRESGNEKLRNAYSSRFSRLKNPKSPVDDILLSSIDFDACLGVVEKEIMHLVDGKLFEGDKTVSELEFLEYLKACEKLVK